MILIIGTITIAEGALDRARPIMQRMIEASRAEDGCLSYSYSVDVLDQRVIHVTEAWASREVLEEHFRAPHLTEWRASWADLSIENRNLRLYETDEGMPV